MSSELRNELREIQDEWGIPLEGLAKMMSVPEERLQDWLSQPLESEGTLPPGLETLAPLLTIYRRLRQKLPSVEDQLKWLTQANKDFGDHPPLEILSSSVENLYWVSYYLETVHSRSL